MSRRVGWVLIGLVIGWAGSAWSQALDVDGGNSEAAEFRSAILNNDHAVLRAEVTHEEFWNTAAVHGISRPLPGAGRGGFFEGGEIGVQGEVRWPDDDYLVYGVWGLATGGGSVAGGPTTGVSGGSVAPDLSGSTAFGVWGWAQCLNFGSECTKRAVYAQGDIEYTGSLVGPTSDIRVKESLAPLDRAVPKLLALEVVSFEYTQTEEISHLNLPRGPQVGFVAQQVAEVLPELVVESVHPEARDPRDKSFVVEPAEPIRYLSLKSLELIPYLVRAIQEQQAEIEELKAELRPLRTRLAALVPEMGVEASPAAAF